MFDSFKNVLKNSMAQNDVEPEQVGVGVALTSKLGIGELARLQEEMKESLNNPQIIMDGISDREYVVEYECPMCQLNWTCVVENVVLAAECPRCKVGNIEPLDSFTLEL